jgi:predicted dehydrogenase
MVAVPNHLHSEITIAAAQSGKHVFFEPPLGMNGEEGEATLAALEAAEGIVQMDLELRCAPVTARVIQMISQGAIGEPLLAKSRLWADWGFAGGDWIGGAQPEGYFLWLGFWYLDLLDCIFPEMPVRADVFAASAKHDGMADHGWATLQYPDSKLGCWEFTMVNCEGQEVSLYVHGTEGELVADIWEGTIRWRSGAGRKSTDNVWREISIPCEQPPHGFAGMYESIASYLDAIINNTPVVANLNVVRRIHAAAMACKTSCAEGRSVEVE